MIKGRKMMALTKPDPLNLLESITARTSSTGIMIPCMRRYVKLLRKACQNSGDLKKSCV